MEMAVDATIAPAMKLQSGRMLRTMCGEYYAHLCYVENARVGDMYTMYAVQYACTSCIGIDEWRTCNFPSKSSNLARSKNAAPRLAVYKYTVHTSTYLPTDTV